jgi:hypothetical protein
MKSLYECEICGFVSANQEKVSACEAKGRPHRFQVGEELRVFYYGPEIEDYVMASIAGIKHERLTHRPLYELELIDRCATPNNVDGKRIHGVSEENLAQGFVSCDEVS